jgi:hypothetical protein
LAVFTEYSVAKYSAGHYSAKYSADRIVGRSLLPMEQIEFIKENVMGWLDAGIIKRTNSPYNSPIFCVPKKQGHGLR